MTFHIHLGAHKTATTFIQSQLHANRGRLLQAGIQTLGIWILRKQFTRDFDRLSYFDGVAPFLVRPALRHRLERIASPDADTTFILSDENFAGLISANYWTSRLYGRAGPRARMLMDLVAPHDAHFFFCIRRYPDYLTSSWLQMVTGGRAPDFDRYLAHFPPTGRGWAEIVESIAAACGPDRLTVWTYEWFREDPARVFSLLAPGVSLEIPLEELRREVLPSLTIKGLKALGALEDKLSADERDRMVRLLRDFKFDPPNPRLDIEDPALLSAYDAKYERDLERIAGLGVTLKA